MGFSSFVLKIVLRYGFGLLRFLLHHFLALIYSGQKKVVPDIKDPILLKSATFLAADIREGKVKCVDVLKSYIRRIREVSPFINAVVEERFLEAIEEATTVDALIASGVKSSEQLAEEKPLLGVPLSVKNLICVKGMHCTACSLIFKDLRAHEDALAVSLMKKAGAICLVTTNSPEFGLNFESNNYLYGRTSNPYDTTRTSGGSSGGEAALIGSGGSVIGLGNDLGGSLRLPSYYTCIFAHKPSRGLISNAGSFPLPTKETCEYLFIGPMCRYAEDLIPTMKVLTEKKSLSLCIGAPVDFSNLKLYYMTNEGGNPSIPEVHHEIIKCQRKIIDYFERVHGIQATKVNIKALRHAFSVWMHKLRSSGGENLSESMTGKKATIHPTKELIKFLMGKSNHTLGTVCCLNVDKFSFIYDKNIEKQHRNIRDSFDAILDANSVFLWPTSPFRIPYHNESPLMFPAMTYMAIFNTLGYPVTQCSMGLGSDGLPVGLQVVGGMNFDNLTIACAIEIEKAFGGWVPPTKGSRSVS